MDKLMIDCGPDNLIYFSDVFSSEKIIQMCKNKFEHVIIITDENVGAHYAQKLLNYFTYNQIQSQLITMPPGEHSKSREMKNSIEDKMFALGCSRDSLIVALGGGVITDLSGFVAATYYRGIPVIYIPTSLLAMVDAAIGGKTGINTDYGKNLIGTFTHPNAIFIDVKMLGTLPVNEYIQAFSEIIKHALIYDYDYFTLIESSIDKISTKDYSVLLKVIKRSCEIKSAIVSEDQTEKSKREILNFGHTIAHALETSSQYVLGHGQAVAIGIIVECYLSNQMALLSDTHFHRIKQLILNLNIPVTFDITFSKEDVMKFLNMDKKIRNDKNRFVVLSNIGKVMQVENSYAQPVDTTLLKKAIDYMFKLCVS